MTVVELPRAFAPTEVDGALMSWWDPDAECTVTIARPVDCADLWQEYLSGAQQSYRRHGIDAAIDVDAIERSGDTTLFWTMRDDTGAVMAGIRAIGPLASPEDTHAVRFQNAALVRLGPDPTGTRFSVVWILPPDLA